MSIVVSLLFPVLRGITAAATLHISGAGRNTPVRALAHAPRLGAAPMPRVGEWVTYEGFTLFLCGQSAFLNCLQLLYGPPLVAVLASVSGRGGCSRHCSRMIVAGGGDSREV